MARGHPTLAELALRQQVRAANRLAFTNWFQGGVSPITYWIGVGLLIASVIAGVVLWRIFL